MQVQGLTFEQDTDIECLFGDKRVKAVYVNEYVALCISPMFDLPGRVDFALQVDMEVHQAPQFTACKLNCNCYAESYTLGTFLHK